MHMPLGQQEYGVAFCPVPSCLHAVVVVVVVVIGVVTAAAAAAAAAIEASQIIMVILVAPMSTRMMMHRGFCFFALSLVPSSLKEIAAIQPFFSACLFIVTRRKNARQFLKFTGLRR